MDRKHIHDVSVYTLVCEYIDVHTYTLFLNTFIVYKCSFPKGIICFFSLNQIQKYKKYMYNSICCSYIIVFKFI